jgi:DMSO/TMAO reductase YedYZ molybdopterin-dependent catalytic subunit
VVRDRNPKEAYVTDAPSIARRRWLQRALGAASGVALSACNKLAQSPAVNSTLEQAEGLTRGVQRLLLGRHALAPEYSASEISTVFRGNGTTDPGTDEYNRHVRTGFSDWRLSVGGLVEKPLELSLADLRQMASRTQITRHDCVEGWSCIAKWGGARLGTVLQQARLQPNARYIAFYCADSLEPAPDGSGQYYETIDLIDAMHPQTLLAYDMNDRPLTVRHGAPLRLRVERQLGYKMAKYLMRIEAIESFRGIARGKGGFWEDRGYEWYAGI